ncbi:hypothetical protein OSB04_020680 [Centaurea solstitialis]|uniref:Sugar phosphate transporter domain-containing protein n=1 Tax=Centaurea solstitialis TaxID=347529 RepID=A0AA38W447_9ASTR|nr:hypothetical protein OSB04_020680 [Centaurea solstitialis]
MPNVVVPELTKGMGDGWGPGCVRRKGTGKGFWNYCVCELVCGSIHPKNKQKCHHHHHQFHQHFLHFITHSPLVLIQHWSPPSQQAPPLQLWLQVPNLPHICHMSACAILSYVSIVFLKVVPFQRIRSRSQFLRIATLSVVFWVPLSVATFRFGFFRFRSTRRWVATTPFFTAMFAYLMTFKREAWVTYGALVPVVTGVVIASGGEPSFHLYGFIMCISATAARAFKSVLQGILLSSEGEKLNSMNLLLYMSPIAIVVLLPAALVMEPDVIDVTVSLALKHRFMWVLLVVNSTMAYAANLTNFLVTKNTSALTLQVLGNAKGAVAVVISILLFRNPVTVVGIAGYSMTVMGVVAYGEAKRRYR